MSTKITHPTIVKPYKTNELGSLAVYSWKCPDCNSKNNWHTPLDSGYVTIRCSVCKKVVSLDKNIGGAQ